MLEEQPVDRRQLPPIWDRGRVDVLVVDQDDPKSESRLVQTPRGALRSPAQVLQKMAGLGDMGLDRAMQLKELSRRPPPTVSHGLGRTSLMPSKSWYHAPVVDQPGAARWVDDAEYY